MSDVHKITIQIRAPRGTFPGEVSIGYYCIADGQVVLTDETGKPIGAEKRYLSPGGDARLIACAMLRQRTRANKGGRPSGFNRQISYPKTGYC